MASSRRFFGGKRAEPASPIVDLGPLLESIIEDVPRWAGATVEPDLIRARLADHYRDARVAPVAPETFAALSTGLDPEAWRRLALAVSALDFQGLWNESAGLLHAPALDQVRAGFVYVAKKAELLTLELLRQSPLRVEEFTRRWLLAMGAKIEGETAQQSSEQLERLDYGRLLAEAEQAQKAAEARMENLRKLQAEQAAKRPRRGKF